MEVGIVGLPVSGKTTLFSALTGQEPEPGFSGKIQVHRGVVKVPDARLDKLTDIFQPKKKVPATIEYIEVGGMDSESKGFDAQFLQVLKNTAALCCVIRAFDSETHPHPAGSVDPARDVQTVESEFLLSDLAIVESRMERLEKQVKKAKDEKLVKELELMETVHTHLEAERPLREMALSEDQHRMVRGYQFLTLKPLVLVLNIPEERIGEEAAFVAAIPEKPHVSVIALCARAEQEIAQLDPDDREVFLEELGIAQPAANRLIRASYQLLGLISFFTVGEDECRAWNVRENSAAPKAAGAIHTDMERGFIRAEVIHYDDFLEAGSLAGGRERGTLRLEGKNYVVKDGDILNIRFNV